MLKLHFPKWPALLIWLSMLHSIAFSQVSEQWVARYTGPGKLFDGGHSITVDVAGNVFVAGQSVGQTTGSDFVTLKYDAKGNELWARRYNSMYNLDDGATFIAIDISGNVYVTGWSHVTLNATAFTTVKYNATGDELWVKHYVGPGNFRNQANALGIDASGNVYVTGVSTGMGTDDDYVTIKYDAAGNELWVRRYNGPGNSGDYPYSIAVSEAGNAYITGGSTGATSSEDYATIKYDAGGNELWVKRYNGPGNSSDLARQIILDEDENVYVTGESIGVGTNYDFATIKYSSAGNEVWVKRYNGPQNFRDQGISLDVDSSGNVYVTGASYPSIPQGSDYATIKYDAVGNEQWVRRYDGPNNGTDFPRALAVDAAGNAFITGSSTSDEGGDDYATVGYNTIGNELWVKRYAAPGDSTDQATAIAVDQTGSVYVTGSSPGIQTGNDIVTIKYGLLSPLKVNAGDDKTVYLGYGSDCIKLNATASGGIPPYSYVWSPGTSTSNGITVCPSATTLYTVAVTDAAGNAASDQVQVKVIDVRCHDNKILVCHNGKELCISRHAVEAHLKHGDQLGNIDCKKDQSSKKPFRIIVNPNPFGNTTRIQYDVPEQGKVLIKIFDGRGRLVSTLVNGDRKPGVYSIHLDASGFHKGMYYYAAILISKNKVFVETGKMLKIK